MNKRQRKRAKRLRDRIGSTYKNDPQPGREDFVNLTKPASGGKPHPLTITFSLIGIFLTIIGLYWAMSSPDIRYIPVVKPETMTTVEDTVDSAGNFIHNVRLRIMFTNYAFKPGFIDRVDFVPESIVTLPDIKITSIDKTFVWWHQKKTIEITFLVSVPSDPVNHLNTTRNLVVDQVLAVYDNTGQRVEHLPNGLYGRIRLNFNQGVTVSSTEKK